MRLTLISVDFEYGRLPFIMAVGLIQSKLPSDCICTSSLLVYPADVAFPCIGNHVIQFVRINLDSAIASYIVISTSVSVSLSG